MSSGNQGDDNPCSESGAIKERGDKTDFSMHNLLSKNLTKKRFHEEKEAPKQTPPPKTMPFELGESHLKWIRDKQGEVDFEVSPYPVKEDPIKAKVVIINIEEYFEAKGVKKHIRKGSGQDVIRLCLAFYKLGIEPEDISIKGPNIEGQQLKSTVSTFASDGANKDLDVFIMVILAHGGRNPQGEDYILTSNYEKVELRKEIVSMFNGQNAPSLLHKPKLFFVEACRGDKEDRGIKTRAGIKEMCSSPLPQPFLPVETDIFIAQPSAPEHKSYRSGDENGSFFIQYLANRLYHEAAGKNLELHRIMAGVANDVAKVELDPEGAEGKKSKDKSFKQALWCTTSLRRPFYFKKLK